MSIKGLFHIISILNSPKNYCLIYFHVLIQVGVTIATQKKVYVFENLCYNDKRFSIGGKMITFEKISNFPKGTLCNQLIDAYSFDSSISKNFLDSWKEYDDFFYSNLDIANKYGFVTLVDGVPVGHITWDPRNRPEYVIIGHNCILTSYKGKGYGKIQLQEAIRRIKEYNVKKVVVTTNEVLIPAQKNYLSVGFKEVARRQNLETPFAAKHIDYELVF